ncbi:MAG: nitroreductase [Acidimicrobiia bacterium]|nr:nitroreductase [Acidimicrobiia bacterium]
MKKLARWVGGVVTAFLFAEFGLLFAFRTGWAPLVYLIRRFNRTIFNPIMLRFAGQPGFYASKLHHVGRSTGKAFTTPIVAIPVEDGFLIPLPYGVSVDWLRNLLVAGGASLARDGIDFELDQPKVLDYSEVTGLLPERMRNRMRMYEVGHYLSVHAVTQPTV